MDFYEKNLGKNTEKFVQIWKICSLTGKINDILILPTHKLIHFIISRTSKRYIFYLFSNKFLVILHFEI